MERIGVATEKSPIAVFQCNAYGKVDAAFAGTIFTQYRIASKHPRLVGVYHGGMSKGLIKDKLRTVAFNDKD